MSPSNKLPEPVLDMGYPSYPPALYRAISYASSLGVPVYVTENGMPSAEEDGGRSKWIEGYLGLVGPLAVLPQSLMLIMARACGLGETARDWRCRMLALCSHMC